MKKMWNAPNAASPTIVALIRGRLSNGVAPSSASEWFAASEIAWANGVHLGAPCTPIADEMARRIAAGDADGAATLRAKMQIEWSTERRAVNRWKGMCQSWLGGPSREEENDAAKKQREALAREEALQRRASELVAEQERATQATRLADARKRAEKEMTR